MPKCKYCGLPVTSGVIVHSECFDNMQIDFKREYARARVIGVECGAERGREIIQALREDRLVVMPCKVGDIIYTTAYGDVIGQIEIKEVSVSFKEDGSIQKDFMGLYGGGYLYISGEEFGETMFSSYEEAKLSLEKGGKK